MNMKIALLAAAFGAACPLAAANAAPIAPASIDAPATQIKDDEGGDVARRILRGVTGGGEHRDRDHDRRRWGHRDDGDRDQGRRHRDND